MMAMAAYVEGGLRRFEPPGRARVSACSPKGWLLYKPNAMGRVRAIRARPMGGHLISQFLYGGHMLGARLWVVTLLASWTADRSVACPLLL